VFDLLGQERVYPCGYSGRGTHDQFCWLCGDTEKPEDMNCKREAREEGRLSPLV
jgi:hypothetical protein